MLDRPGCMTFNVDFVQCSRVCKVLFGELSLGSGMSLAIVGEYKEHSIPVQMLDFVYTCTSVGMLNRSPGL